MTVLSRRRVHTKASCESVANAVRRSFSEGGHDRTYVYLIQSSSCPGQRYVEIADDFEKRLQGYNSGNSKHTPRFRPWKPVVVIRFENHVNAVAFEKYLKFGDGPRELSAHGERRPLGL